MLETLYGAYILVYLYGNVMLLKNISLLNIIKNNKKRRLYKVSFLIIYPISILISYLIVTYSLAPLIDTHISKDFQIIFFILLFTIPYLLIGLGDYYIKLLIDIHLGKINFQSFSLLNKSKKNSKSLLKNNLIEYIQQRPKNIIASIFLIHFIKVFTHYFFFSATTIIRNTGRSPRTGRSSSSRIKNDDLSEYFENIYSDEVFLFLPVIVIYLFVVWYFNDKIKAK
tara:strand:- start:59 stop:736 length:678 start_codon:yes stop_codon:yes gene_type:complete